MKRIFSFAVSLIVIVFRERHSKLNMEPAASFFKYHSYTKISRYEKHVKLLKGKDFSLEIDSLNAFGDSIFFRGGGYP
jgi:hypothetical protein